MTIQRFARGRVLQYPLQAVFKYLTLFPPLVQIDPPSLLLAIIGLPRYCSPAGMSGDSQVTIQ